MEVGEEGYYYTCRYAVITGMTPTLRWAVMTAILMFHNCEGQSHTTVSTDHIFLKRKESRRGFEPTSLCDVHPVGISIGLHTVTLSGN